MRPWMHAGTPYSLALRPRSAHACERPAWTPCYQTSWHRRQPTDCENHCECRVWFAASRMYPVFVSETGPYHLTAAIKSISSQVIIAWQTRNIEIATHQFLMPAAYKMNLSFHFAIIRFIVAIIIRCAQRQQQQPQWQRNHHNV